MGEIQRDKIDKCIGCENIGHCANTEGCLEEEDMANYNRAEKSSRWAGGLRRRNGYVYMMKHEHQLANKEGYVMRAVLVWEKTNGRPFPEGKMPHHKNLAKDDDRPENIVPLTMSQHMKIHAKLREINKILREAETNG